MAWFPIVRLSVLGRAFSFCSTNLTAHYVLLHCLGWVIFCAIVNLGLSGDVTSVVEKYNKDYFGYSALGIAVSLLTLFSFPTM